MFRQAERTSAEGCTLQGAAPFYWNFIRVQLCSNFRFSNFCALHAVGWLLPSALFRQSEGTSPEGYTLQEACVMTRSSLPKQRVLALRIISAVLTAARPQPSHHDTAGVLVPRQVDLPSTVQETAASEVSAVLTFVVWLSGSNCSAQHPGQYGAESAACLPSS